MLPKHSGAIRGGVRMSGGRRQSKFKYGCWRTTSAGRMYCASNEDSERAFPNQNEGRLPELLQVIWGIAVSDLLNNNAAHTYIALERFRAAHCVYSGTLLGDI